MIHTYAIIIAATLNTISASMSLSHCLTDVETGVSASGTMSRLTHPGQGCPQRSQLQPACASVSRTGNSSNATSFNISLAVSASSLNKRVGFIESLPVLPKLRRSLVARLGICWLLLCKNCVEVWAAYPRRYPLSRRDFVNAYETSRRHDCRLCAFPRGRQR